MDYILYADGNRCTYLNGELHSYNDKPALINSYGAQYWYKEGKLHREDGPAIIRLNIDQAWYMGDIKHREGGPAIICPNGYQAWYKEGKLHRDALNNSSFVLPAVIHLDGHAEWWIDEIKIKECENYQPQTKSARN